MKPPLPAENFHDPPPEKVSNALASLRDLSRGTFSSRPFKFSRYFRMRKLIRKNRGTAEIREKNQASHNKRVVQFIKQEKGIAEEPVPEALHSVCSQNRQTNLMEKWIEDVCDTGEKEEPNEQQGKI